VYTRVSRLMFYFSH